MDSSAGVENILLYSVTHSPPRSISCCAYKEIGRGIWNTLYVCITISEKQKLKF